MQLWLRSPPRKPRSYERCEWPSEMQGSSNAENLVKWCPPLHSLYGNQKLQSPFVPEVAADMI